MPAEHEAKLFQPFYTTKPVGEGTGLGLSVSYDIIRSHNGRIGYRRGATGGAVFFFELPIVPNDQLTVMTQRIYYTEPYRRSFDATVLSVERVAGHIARHARSDRVLSDIGRPAVRHRHARRRRGDRRDRSRGRHHRARRLGLA